MKKLIISIAIILAAMWPAANEAKQRTYTPQPTFYSGSETIDLKRFTQIVETALARPEAGGTTIGFKAVDMKSGTVVFDRNSDTLFNPASNMKLVSTAAALYGLGAGYRFSTVIRSAAAPDASGVIKGSIYVIGRGDPWLTDENTIKMVNDLYDTGVRTVEGDIVIDDTYFDSIRSINGWENKSLRHCYEAPIGAMSVNFNCLWITVHPAGKAGSKARVEVHPDIDMFRLSNQVRTVKKGRSGVGLKMNISKNSINLLLSGRVSISDTSGIGVCRKIDNPPVYAGHALYDYMKKKGIRIKGAIKVRKADQEARHELLVYKSPPLEELVYHLNKESNNFMAEQTFKTLGAEKTGLPGTCEGGAQFTEQFLAKVIGAKPGSYRIENGSGLGLENRVTPDLLIRVLKFMDANPAYANAYMNSLPIMGLDGTLRNRHRFSDAANRIRAKTGFINNVITLTGYVETKGCDRLAFSLLMNKYDTKRRANLRKVQDEIILALSNLVLMPGNPGCASANIAK